MLSKHTFRWLYTSDVIKTTDYYAKSLSGKVLPSFEDISEEADKAEQGCYNRLASLSDPESFDPGDIVDDARDAGVAFYIMAKGVRQGIINLFTAGLYHLFEQQALRLYRTELLWSGEENIPGLLTVKEARQRLLEDYEIDIFAFPSWSKLEELRL